LGDPCPPPTACPQRREEVLLKKMLTKSRPYAKFPSPSIGGMEEIEEKNWNQAFDNRKMVV
jgi:hypothetical protein